MTLIILMYALSSSSFFITKILLRFVPPFLLTSFRMMGAGVILLLYQYFIAHKHFRLKPKHWWLFAQLTFFGIYVTYLLRFWGLNYMPSSKTAFFYNMSPFFSAIFSYAMFREKLSLKQFAGLLIGFVGLIPLLISTSSSEQQLGEMFYISWAELAVLLSVASHSYSWVLMRKLIRDKKYMPSMVNGVSMFVGGLAALITSLVLKETQVNNPEYVIGLLAFIIFTNNIISYNLYGHLLKKYTATFLSFGGFIGPLFAALYGWAFLHERITWHFYLSAIIVFVGLYLFYQDELKKVHPPVD